MGIVCYGQERLPNTEYKPTQSEGNKDISSLGSDWSICGTSLKIPICYEDEQEIGESSGGKEKTGKGKERLEESVIKEYKNKGSLE